MKKVNILSIIALAGLATALEARPVVNINPKTRPATQDNRMNMFANTCEPASQSADLDINNVRTKILNGGDMWWDLNNPKYEIPKVTDANTVRKHSLFSGALWIGGLDDGGNLKLAAMTYRQRGSDFWPGPLDITTAATDPQRCKTYDRIWRVTRTEMEEAQEGGWISPSSNISDWPAGFNRPYATSTNEPRSLAPFKDINANGIYEPFQGEHPVLDDRRPISENGVDKQPDQMLWFCYNDKGNIHSETQGVPIGLELHTTAFAFATNDEVNNMTFYSTTVINRSFSKLNKTYFGEWVDADLGNYADDYVGCDVGRSLGYCYNGDEDDEGVLGYGLNPPSVGVDFFEGPRDSAGNELGMSAFMYYNNDANPINGNPFRGAQEFYNLLQGKWLGGQNVTFGGNGIGGSRTTRYMFSAGTDPDFPGECWDERGSGNRPGDRRFLQVSGPFTLFPGAVNRVTVGVVWARTTSGGAGAPCSGNAQGSLSLLRLASDKAQRLFNNNFKILDGPDAPEIEMQELEGELVMKLVNTNSARVERYQEEYINENNQALTYKFQGYMIYQLKDASVNTGDLNNIDRARLLFQCDIKDNFAQIINRVFDPKVNAYIPEEMVNGENAGLRHSFSIKNDLFAQTANQALVDFRTYYYMVLSYGVLVDDTLSTEPVQFLAGRRNIQIIRGIPHKTDPENFGTKLNAGYGSGPSLKRIEGRGNGGNVLEFTQETVDEILRNGHAPNPVYMGGNGPVKVKVVDPLKVPKGDFELVLQERRPSANTTPKDTITKFTDWFVVNKTTGDTVFSDTMINYKFETLQGRAAITNEQSTQYPNRRVSLRDWGLSVEIVQVTNPGDDPNGDVSNGMIEWSVEWEDPGRQWLTAVADNDAATGANIWQNWIRSGNAGRGSTFAPYEHDMMDASANPLDPNASFEKIWGGRVAPYGLVARAGFDAASNRNTFGFAWRNSAISDNPLTELASIDLVITPDRSKWSECIVLEMADEQVKAGTEGEMDKFNMRWGTSRDRNLNPIGTRGRSYFPGYAVNLETGERLNIAFGEDSYLPGENGRDMIWNPTDNYFNDNGNYPALGGKHFIYIFGTGYSFGVNRTVKGERYPGGLNTYQQVLLPANPNTSPGTIDKRRILSQVMWVVPTLAAAGYDISNGVPPTEVKIRIRIKKAYTTYATSGTPVNNDRPMYSFNTDDIAPVISAEHGTKSLDLVNVVPNPYRAFSKYQTSPIDARVKITNLPPTCTISIYNLSGSLVRRIEKADERTFVDWDLKNNASVPIASGLYLIHVKAPGLGEKVVRWYGIMQAIDLDSY
jgi:hypothetical protein